MDASQADPSCRFCRQMWQIRQNRQIRIFRQIRQIWQIRQIRQIRQIQQKLLSLTYILYRKCTVEPPSTVQKEYSGAYGVHFGYCRRFGVADGEREPLVPLGCYIYSIALYGSFPGRTICWFCRIF